MSRLVITSFGDPVSSVELVEDADLTLGADDVLIRMEAAVLNDTDLLITRRMYAIKPALPSPIGVEGVGKVVDAGRSALDLVGKRVVVLPTFRQGTWADHVVAHRSSVLVVDVEADPLQLAMLPINPATAHLLLTRFGGLKSGDWVGQTAANSAVGQYLIGLAKVRGLRTLNVVRRESAAKVVRRISDDPVIVAGPDLARRAKEELGGTELALVVDPIGGASSGAAELASALRFGGPVVSYGSYTGQPPIIGVADLVFRHVQLTGLWMANWVRTAPRAELEHTYTQLAEQIAAGTLRAPVEATYRLPDYREAIAHAAAKERHGKILFTFD